MASSTADLHIFFLPLLSPGHMIPMVDLAILVSARIARSTIVTTPANENLTALPVPDITSDFFAFLCRLEPHLDRLLLAHRPDCIVSDIFFPWTAALAKRHRIPRIAFHGTSYFCSVLMQVVGNNIHLHEPSFSGAEEPFLVAGIPHSVKLTRSQLPEFLISPGLAMNTFYELEPAYADYSKGSGLSYWNVGPVSLCRRSFEILSARGGGSAGSEVFGWLDGKEAGSVLYVCFGSLPRFTTAQFGLIRDGLKAAGRPFVWAVGFVIKGWAPQVAILMHEAVGGFMTHCGWNSCLEGIAAGVPMVTWPLFADQSFNERLLVDVLDLAVDVGSTVNSLREEDVRVLEASA
ncbi:UDP-glucose flavonoid 3-O-glucosyltransferase 7 [Platanthera zijinensis]|uniref:UDP-glucose flavonoid 3-O-glucosyltransferase 7 n=1 Tax=Platanthera zijinensis TaxID=2320716 RepID=A0AAP0BRL7_9ASPA